MTLLRDLTAAMDAVVDNTLGDAITYTPDGGAALSLNAWVRFADLAITGSGSQTTREAVSVEVPMALVASPAKEDVIAIAVLPGRTYRPKGYAPDETGVRWVIELARIAA